MFSSFGFKAGSQVAKWSGIGAGLNHDRLEAGEESSGVLEKELFSPSTNQLQRSNPMPGRTTSMKCFHIHLNTLPLFEFI